MNTFFHYCYEGDIINVKSYYCLNYPYIDIRWKHDKIFKFCCKAVEAMDGYNEIFTNQAKKILEVIMFIRNLSCMYHVVVKDNKLIEWDIKKQIIITI